MNSSQAMTFEEVGARLLDAGWVEIFSLNNGSVCGLRWTAKGEQGGLLLRPIIKTFGLDHNADRPKKFTDDCASESAGLAERSLDIGKQFWIACLRDLALESDRNVLWVFVRMIGVGDELATLSLTSPELANRRLDGIIESHG